MIASEAWIETTSACFSSRKAETNELISERWYFELATGMLYWLAILITWSKTFLLLNPLDRTIKGVDLFKAFETLSLISDAVSFSRNFLSFVPQPMIASACSPALTSPASSSPPR